MLTILSGAAPQYRDVIFEDSIKVAGGTRAPDYCFTLAGRKMFFVEAKKPSVNIDKDIKTIISTSTLCLECKITIIYSN